MNYKKLIKFTIIIGITTLICYVLGFFLNCFFSHEFNFIPDKRLMNSKQTWLYTALFFALALAAILSYYYKHYWLLNTNKIIKGNKKDNDIVANLEQAKFENDKEINTNFPKCKYDELKKVEAGIAVKAEQIGKRYYVNLAKNTHVLIIGTTGSGKTATFISPSIQILSETKSKPSLLITDPKGELYILHSKSLEKKGYKIKILDLRNPFNSIKWNPLERPFKIYQRMLRLAEEVIEDEEKGACIFEGKEYYGEEEINGILQVKKQQLYDLVYEDLNDIITVLCPITNKQEPIWESGAKNLCLAIALAMLEDSENPDLGMSIDKFNFFNLSKIATNTENECKSLIAYFQNRSPISRCVSLSKQVLDSAEKTRGSYLSTLFDKLNLFADLSLCSLTSENEITFEDLAETPTAVFLQIPDERETRHTLAAMVLLQAYKELVHKANQYKDLTLPRPVYFLLDEFGNMPAIHRIEQMITVGRSRNIWLNLVVQSYAQLAKVYDDKVAEIIKSNCNIQIFIGSTDLKTIEDFSKRCGNYTVITRNVGYSTVKGEDINSNASLKERPLIYPSELQQLNSATNMGNAIVTVFGYQPIKSKLTPFFKVKALKLEKSTEREFKGKYFDEAKVFYDMKKRNRIIVSQKRKSAKNSGAEHELYIEHIKEIAGRCLKEVLDTTELINLMSAIDNSQFIEAIRIIDEANKRAIYHNKEHIISSIDELMKKLNKLIKNVKTNLNQIGDTY